MSEDTDNNADAGADTHTDRDGDRDRDGRRPGDHPTGPGFDPDILPVARAAVADACEAAETPWASTRQVAAQFSTGRFTDPNETAALLRAAADRGLLRRRMDLAVGADHPPTERWRVR